MTDNSNLEALENAAEKGNTMTEELKRLRDTYQGSVVDYTQEDEEAVLNLMNDTGKDGETAFRELKKKLVDNFKNSRPSNTTELKLATSLRMAENEDEEFEVLAGMPRQPRINFKLS